MKLNKEKKKQNFFFLLLLQHRVHCTCRCPLQVVLTHEFGEITHELICYYVENSSGWNEDPLFHSPWGATDTTGATQVS